LEVDDFSIGYTLNLVFQLCGYDFLSSYWNTWSHKCTGVHIFGDAKNVCPNLILFSQIMYKQQVLMLRLKRAIVKQSRFLHA